MPQTPEQRKASYLKNKEKIAAYKKLWYKRNKSKILQKSAEYRAANKDEIKIRKAKRQIEHKDRLNKISKSYYHQNKDRAKEISKAYYEKNKEDIKARTALWQKSNPEKNKLLRANYKGRRRARQHKTSIGRVSYKAVKERNGMVCGICTLEIKDKYHYDHIIPLAKGGSHTTGNIQLAHPKCNQLKADKLNFVMGASE